MSRMFFRVRTALACVALVGIVAPSSAYLYWGAPVAKGQPVNGDEPGIVLPMPGATPKELRAGLVWSLRAGLNVAALQCQFAPGLQSVDLYNDMLRQHATELQDAYKTIGAYYKRTLTPPAPPTKGKKKAKAPTIPDKVWVGAAEGFNTRTYNSFSTLHAQFTFCDTAASIGRDAAATPAGQMGDLAARRMQEFRNSLVPVGDPGLDTRSGTIALDPLPPTPCVNARGKIVKCRAPKA